MRIYTIYCRRQGSPPILIAEAFSWPAALFQPVWGLWQGAWRTAFCLLPGALLPILAPYFDLMPGPVLAMSAVIMVASGLLGPDILRWDLEQRGYHEARIIAAPDRDTAWRKWQIASPDEGHTHRQSPKSPSSPEEAGQS